MKKKKKRDIQDNSINGSKIWGGNIDYVNMVDTDILHVPAVNGDKGLNGGDGYIAGNNFKIGKNDEGGWISEVNSDTYYGLSYQLRNKLKDSANENTKLLLSSGTYTNYGHGIWQYSEISDSDTTSTHMATFKVDDIKEKKIKDPDTDDLLYTEGKQTAYLSLKATKYKKESDSISEQETSIVTEAWFDIANDESKLRIEYPFVTDFKESGVSKALLTSNQYGPSLNYYSISHNIAGLQTYLASGTSDMIGSKLFIGTTVKLDKSSYDHDTVRLISESIKYVDNGTTYHRYNGYIELLNGLNNNSSEKIVTIGADVDNNVVKGGKIQVDQVGGTEFTYIKYNSIRVGTNNARIYVGTSESVYNNWNWSGTVIDDPNGFVTKYGKYHIGSYKGANNRGFEVVKEGEIRAYMEEDGYYLDTINGTTNNTLYKLSKSSSGSWEYPKVELYSSYNNGTPERIFLIEQTSTSPDKTILQMVLNKNVLHNANKPDKFWESGAISFYKATEGGSVISLYDKPYTDNDNQGDYKRKNPLVQILATTSSEETTSPTTGSIGVYKGKVVTETGKENTLTSELTVGIKSIIDTTDSDNIKGIVGSGIFTDVNYTLSSSSTADFYGTFHGNLIGNTTSTDLDVTDTTFQLHAQPNALSVGTNPVYTYGTDGGWHHENEFYKFWVGDVEKSGNKDETTDPDYVELSYRRAYHEFKARYIDNGVEKDTVDVMYTKGMFYNLSADPSNIAYTISGETQYKAWSTEWGTGSGGSLLFLGTVENGSRIHLYDTPYGETGVEGEKRSGALIELNAFGKINTTAPSLGGHIAVNKKDNGGSSRAVDLYVDKVYNGVDDNSDVQYVEKGIVKADSIRTPATVRGELWGSQFLSRSENASDGFKYYASIGYEGDHKTGVLRLMRGSETMYTETVYMSANTHGGSITLEYEGKPDYAHFHTYCDSKHSYVKLFSSANKNSQILLETTDTGGLIKLYSNNSTTASTKVASNFIGSSVFTDVSNNQSSSSSANFYGTFYGTLIGNSTSTALNVVKDTYQTYGNGRTIVIGKNPIKDSNGNWQNLAYLVESSGDIDVYHKSEKHTTRVFYQNLYFQDYTSGKERNHALLKRSGKITQYGSDSTDYSFAATNEITIGAYQSSWYDKTKDDAWKPSDHGGKGSPYTGYVQSVFFGTNSSGSRLELYDTGYHELAPDDSNTRTSPLLAMYAPNEFNTSTDKDKQEMYEGGILYIRSKEVRTKDGNDYNSVTDRVILRVAKKKGDSANKTGMVYSELFTTDTDLINSYGSRMVRDHLNNSNTANYDLLGAIYYHEDSEATETGWRARAVLGGDRSNAKGFLEISGGENIKSDKAQVEIKCDDSNNGKIILRDSGYKIVVEIGVA